MDSIFAHVKTTTKNLAEKERKERNYSIITNHVKILPNRSFRETLKI